MQFPHEIQWDEKKRDLSKMKTEEQDLQKVKDPPSQQGLEYANCIPCRVDKTPTSKKWVRSSSSGTVGSVEYSFITITPKFTLTQNDNTLGSNLWVK